MTESEVLEIIDRISSRLCHKFTFGFHTHEDIKQQAFIEACKGLITYDGKRPLENFLWIHIKNRLCNFKRDNFERIDKPCLKCPLKAFDKSLPSECKLYNNKSECELYNAWVVRNAPKKNLVNCLDLDNIDDEYESRMSKSQDFVGDIEQGRLLSLIDEKIPLNLRSYYVKLKAGLKIPRQQREEIKAIIGALISDNDQA